MSNRSLRPGRCTLRTTSCPFNRARWTWPAKERYNIIILDSEETKSLRWRKFLITKLIIVNSRLPRLAAAIGSKSKRSKILFTGPSSSSMIETAVSDGKGGTWSWKYKRERHWKEGKRQGNGPSMNPSR